jgi:uncharacterized protein YndB with AHSA1/START domain
MKTALRWIGAAFGTLVLVMVVIIGIGLALPVSHTASCAATIAAPRDRVWKTISDPLDYGWRSDVARVDLAGASVASQAAGSHAPALRWTETDRYGHSIGYERVSAEPMRHLVTRIADPTAPFGGTWTYDLTPAKQGTTVAIVENGEIYNPVFRLVSRFFVGYTATMRGYLADLGKRFGATPAVSCVIPPG